MKKIIITFCSISLIALMLFLFSGCQSLNNEELISDLRYGIFDGEGETYNATFTYGLREKPYYPDGIVNPKVEFGIISVIFAEKINDGDTVYYSIKINDNIISGILEKSPYTDQYMADIGRICSDSDLITLEIYFESNSTPQVISLTNKNLSWNIDYKEAFKNGIEALAENIKEFKEKKSSYEVQVKILNEQQTNFGVYFWSVTIISSEGDKHNVVFATNSPDILLKN